MNQSRRSTVQVRTDRGAYWGYSWVVTMHGVHVSKDGYHICTCGTVEQARAAIEEMAS